MPNRKYGAFNTKMTNTIKEGRMPEPAVDPAACHEGSCTGRSSRKWSQYETQTLRKDQEILAFLPLPERFMVPD
jgi:hypothetical protein